MVRSYLTTSSGTNSPSFSVAPMYRWSPFINRRSSSLRRFIWQTEVKDPYLARVNRMLLSSNIKRYIQRKNRCIFKNLVRGRKIKFHELLTLTRSINYTCNRTKKSSALNIDQDSSHQLLRKFWVSVLRYMNFIVKYWLICEKKSRKHTRDDGKRKWCFIIYENEDLVNGLNCSRGVLVEFQWISRSCSVGHIACKEEKKYLFRKIYTSKLNQNETKKIFINLSYAYCGPLS